jgi:hypothetical protein
MAKGKREKALDKIFNTLLTVSELANVVAYDWVPGGSAAPDVKTSRGYAKEVKKLKALVAKLPDELP